MLPINKIYSSFRVSAGGILSIEANNITPTIENISSYKAGGAIFIKPIPNKYLKSTNRNRNIFVLSLVYLSIRHFHTAYKGIVVVHYSY